MVALGTAGPFELEGAAVVGFRGGEGKLLNNTLQVNSKRLRIRRRSTSILLSHHERVRVDCRVSTHRLRHSGSLVLDGKVRAKPYISDLALCAQEIAGWLPASF